MIYYLLHLAYIFIGSKFFWSKTNLISDLSRKRFVNILDCDMFRYMANSKYSYYMDFIRFEKMFRSELFANTVKKGMYPVLGSQKVIYKIPLKRWSSFTTTLVLEGWDEKWVYHKQVFEQHNRIVAIGYTKVAFWRNKKAQNIPKILKNSGVKQSQMPVPQKVRTVFERDYELLQTNTTQN